MKYEAIFFSPHLDDAILSCGGLIANLVKNKKKLLIVTVFNGTSDKKITKDTLKHIKACGFDDVWKLARKRESEDKEIAKILKIDIQWMGELEANYRENYNSYRDIVKIGAIDGELFLIKSIKDKVKNILAKSLDKNGKIYFPLGIGKHIDHLIINRIGISLAKFYKVFFWGDYPYILYSKNRVETNKYLLSWRLNISEEINLKETLIKKYDSQNEELFRYKEMYLSSFENYYQLRKNNTNFKIIHYISDELIGGARTANDYLVDGLGKYLKEKLFLYEQIAPRINGKLRRVRRWLWSVANFYKYLKNVVSEGDQVLTTSPNMLMALLFTQKKIKKVIYYSHADRGGKMPFLFTSAWIYWFWYRLMERISIGKVSLVIVSSEDAKKRILSRLGWWIKNKKIEIIPNGVDDKFFCPVKIKRDKNLVMYCGRIDPSKKIEVLIEAVLKLKRVKLLIVHPKIESDNDNYVNKLKGLGRKRINWVCPKSKLEIVEKYSQVECVVVPSDNESFSLVLLEALACGTLVVGREVGEIGVVLKKIDTNLVLKNGDFREIADKISYVMELDEEERKKLLLESKRILRNYSWERSIKKLWKELV